MFRRSALKFAFAATPTTLAPAPGTPSFKCLTDVVNVAKRSEGGKVPLHHLVPKLTPLSKDVIFKSGTGVEGFLKIHSDTVNIVEENGVKYVEALPNAFEELHQQPAAAAAQGSAMNPGSSAPQQINRSGAAVTGGAGGGVNIPVASSSALNASETQDGELVELPTSHPAYRLVKRIREVCTENAWYGVNEVYNLVYSTDESKQTVKHKDFYEFLKSFPEVFWVTKAHFKLRRGGETVAPPQNEGNIKSFSRKKNTAAAAASATNATSTVANANAQNNFGGWGAQQNIPTAEDIYEILKYIPIQWANLGNLGLPAPIKKKHVRISSFLQWLRRQPRYFEVRNIAGTLEVRRAITLHPEQHGMTKEEAEALVAKRLEDGIHNNIQPVAATEGSVGSNASSAQSAVHKFLARVCPAYFVPMELILERRATKKAINSEDLWRSSAELPETYEELVLKNGRKLLRKRLGYDSSNWREKFEADVNSAEDIDLLVNIMGKAPPLWDRTHYLYVRLSDEDKTAVGGFEGMVELLQRHPSVFKVGEFFYKRINSADPVAEENDNEPTSSEITSSKVVEENIYLTPTELAKVFHYLTPENESTTAAYFVEASSPAMRSVLPPRLITLLQTFPELFLCQETAPGMFSVERRKDGTDGNSATDMKPEEVVEAVANLIPIRGVDLAQLQVWMSYQLKNAVAVHFTTLADLIRKNPGKFHLVEQPPYTTVFKQR